MWLIGIGVAHAGFAVGGVVGGEIPTDDVLSLDPGPVVGVLAGWRADVVMLHLQPEVQVLYSTVNEAVALNAGAAVTLLSPLSFGAAAHVGTSLGNGSTWDALGVIELTMIPKIKPGVRAGVESISYDGGSQLFGVVEAVAILTF